MSAEGVRGRRFLDAEEVRAVLAGLDVPPRPGAIDYRALLEQYMRLVHAIDWTTHIEPANRGGHGVKFHDDDWRELVRLSRAVTAGDAGVSAANDYGGGTP